MAQSDKYASTMPTVDSNMVDQYTSGRCSCPEPGDKQNYERSISSTEGNTMETHFN